MADLDEDEYDALIGAVKARRRAEQWDNTHELLAAAVEALWAVLGRLEAGIAVVQVEKTEKALDRGRYPRPDHVDDTPSASAETGVLVVHSVREALTLMKGGNQ